MRYLALEPHGGEPLVLIDGPVFEPWVLVEYDLGSPVIEQTYGAPRGTQGARAAQEKISGRTLTFLLRGYAQSKDAAAADLAELSGVVEELRAYGGRVTCALSGQTHRQHFEVLGATAQLSEWGRTLENRDQARPALDLQVAPYALGDPMDVEDDFRADSLGDYELAVGSATGMTFGPEGLVIADGAKRTLVHDCAGYRHEDLEVVVLYDPGSAGSLQVTAVLRASSAGRLEVVRTPSQVLLLDGGAQVGAAAVSGEYTGALRARIEGERVMVEVAPLPGVGVTLPARVRFALPEGWRGVAGRAGFGVEAATGDTRIERVRIWPFTYRARSDARDPASSGLDMRARLGAVRARGRMPGDAPALVAAHVSDELAEVAFPAEVFGLLAWSEHPAGVPNLYQHGDDPLEHWSAAAVTGVIGAGQGVDKQGVEDTSMTSAGAGTGAHASVWGEFEVGRTYTARLEVRGGATGSGSVRLRAGTPNDTAAGASVALPDTTWRTLEVSWSPSADVERCYLALEDVDAAHTIFFRRPCLWEGDLPPSTGRQLEGFGAAAPMGTFPAVASTRSITPELTAVYDAAIKRTVLETPVVLAPGGAWWAAYWWVDPGAIPADPHSGGTLALECWARLRLDPALGEVLLNAGIAVEGAEQNPDEILAHSYPIEHGRRGVVITPSLTQAWRLCRVGTIVVRAEPQSRPRASLRLSVQVGPGTNGVKLGIDHVMLVPARSRALSDTAKPLDASYPRFLPGGGPKLVGSDLAGLLIGPGGERQGHSGLGGSLLEFPSAEVSLLARISSRVPDDPVPRGVLDAFDPAPGHERSLCPDLHLSVTPRWSYLRPPEEET